MANFKYAPIPATVLCNPEISATMKLRYGLLLGAAFNKPTITMNLTQIAALWAEAEGDTLDTDSITAYLSKMTQAGLIRRERKSRFNWITHLLQRYDKRTQTATANNTQPTTHSQQHATQDLTPTGASGSNLLTPTPHRGQNSLTPTRGSGSISNILDVVVFESLSKQQQQLVNYLERFGILQPTALSLILAGVEAETIVFWVEYAKQQHNLTNPPGFAVQKIGSRDEPPDITLYPPCPVCQHDPCSCGFW